MRKSHSYVTVILLCIMMAVFTGCKNSTLSNPSLPGSETTASVDKTSDGDNNGKINNEIYRVSISEFITLEIPASRLEQFHEQGYTILRAQRQYFDIDEVRDSLMPDSDIVYEEYFNEGNVYNCESEAESLSVENPGSVTCCTADYLNKVSPLRILLNKASDEYSPQKLISSEDLPFMTQEQARNKATESISELSGESFKADKLYIFSDDIMRERLDNVSVSYSDSAYFITLRQELNGLYLIDNPHGSPDYDTYVPGTSAVFSISENGIICIHISGAFEILEESAENSDICIIDSSEAIDVILEQYEQMIATDRITITDMELMYVPVISNRKNNEYLLTPAWCFTVSKEIKYGGKTYERESFVLIDATTGEEIL